MPSALADEDEHACRLVGGVRLVVDEHDARVEDDELALGDPAVADCGVVDSRRDPAPARQELDREALGDVVGDRAVAALVVVA